MNANFEKIQKRLLVVALIKSIVLGVAVGLLCAGAVLLGLKLAEIYINPAYFVLIGVGAAVIVCGLSFLILCPNDKKTAKYLDREYALNEKIQTMVEFAEEDSAMLSMQREDANEKLASLPPRKPKLSKLWQYAVVGVLGVALFVTSVAIPAKFTPVDGDKDVPFTFTDRQKEALNQLVSDVRTTHLDEKNLETAVTSLENLYTALESAGTENLMKAAVLTTVSIIDIALYTQNTFDDISFALGKAEKLKTVSDAVTSGVTFYKSSAMPYVSIDQVNAADKTLESTVNSNLSVGVDEYREGFKITKEEGLGDYITERLKEINSALVTVNVQKDDALKVAFENFTKAGAAVAENAANNYSDNALQDSLNSAFATLKGEMTVALMPQAYNCIVDEFVRRSLAQIFGIGFNELPALASGVQELDDSSGSDDDDDDENNGGGAGKGDFVAGSNATIFHPDTGEIVPYAQYISVYYSNATSQIQNPDGGVPEELKDYILQYFNWLYTGIDKEQNSGE